jgi:hypothetical protein
MNSVINEEIAKVITSGKLIELWNLYLSLRINFPKELINSNDINLVENGISIKFNIRQYLNEINMYEDKKNEKWVVGQTKWNWYDVKSELEDREAILRNKLMNINMVEDMLVVGGYER